ncbi:MAG: 23S rRNA (adenine(2503)-C(2))-methyltransferase RlmN, partial [candidate division KSB1 bacterium]
ISQRRDAEKFLFKLHDDLRLESVLMHEGDRHTLCVSSQVGCPIDCQFCATGKMGLLRNLSAGEIVNQFLTVRRLTLQPITNVVVMGMGEPMLNYEELIKACNILSDEEGPNLAQKHIVISTSGLIPKIRRFKEDGHKFRLAISLNATTDEVRNRLMPLNRKWPIADLLAAAKEYALASKQLVTFEYVLLAGVNDSLEDATRLKRLLRDIPCKVNLIPFNAIDENFQRPGYEQIEAFYNRLKDMSAPVTVRWSKGDDIDAACGQLWTKAEKIAA